MDDRTAPSAAGESPLWYREGDRVVFTREYHLRRGACCGNGCRHCPYNGRKGTTEPTPIGDGAPRGAA